LVPQQLVEHAPCEGAMRPSALQRQIDPPPTLLPHLATAPPAALVRLSSEDGSSEAAGTRGGDPCTSEIW